MHKASRVVSIFPCMIKENIQFIALDNNEILLGLYAI
jgi:hypothetical protein